MATSRTRHRRTRNLAVCAVLTGLIFSGGCVASYKGSQPPPQGTTLGQELIDLKKARDGGAMTDEEYVEQKSRLLDSETVVADAPADPG